MLVGIGLIISFGACLLIYGLIKIKSIYKVFFAIHNKEKIKDDIKKINDKLKTTTDPKEKNKLLNELKKTDELFVFRDKEVEASVVDRGFYSSWPDEDVIVSRILDQFNTAIGFVTGGFVVLIIGIILEIIRIVSL